MPPRALWKGSISFGLLTVPISLVSAAEPRETLTFNLLHRKDGSRIVEKQFCMKEDVDRDTYSEALRQVIEAKLEGKQSAASEQPAPSRVTDLMEALKRSLKERPQELSRAAGRRPRASRRGGRKNAAA